MTRSRSTAPTPSAAPVQWQRMPLLFLFGATVGAGLDWLHTHGDEIRYPDGTNHWRGIWTMGTMYAVGGYLYTIFVQRLGRAAPPLPYLQTIPSLLLYALGYAFTAYGDTHSALIAAVLFAEALVLWWCLEGSAVGFAGSVVAAVIGAGIESTLSHFDTMSYVVQDVVRIPVWLPAIYFLCAQTWGQVCRRALTIA